MRTPKNDPLLEAVLGLDDEPGDDLRPSATEVVLRRVALGRRRRRRVEAGVRGAGLLAVAAVVLLLWKGTGDRSGEGHRDGTASGVGLVVVHTTTALAPVMVFNRPDAHQWVATQEDGLVQVSNQDRAGTVDFVSGEAELLAQLPLGSGWIGAEEEGRRWWLGAGEDPRADGP
jgi:hypothetical protein